MAIFRHLVQVRGDDLYKQLVAGSEDHAVQEIAMNYEQQLIEQGREEGREEGDDAAVAKAHLAVRVVFDVVQPR